MNMEINDEQIVDLDGCKRRAAVRAVDDFINEKVKVVGIGSGKTAYYATMHIIERYNTEDELCDMVFLPASNIAKGLIIKYELPIGDLNLYPEVDVLIDSVSEIDHDLVAIKGNDGYLMQEKFLGSSAKTLIAVGDYTKFSTTLGTNFCRGIPVEVFKTTYLPTQLRIESLLGGECHLRMALAKSGPLVSDSNLFMLEWKINRFKRYNWRKVYDTIKYISGVAAVGLWVDMFNYGYFGMANGTVKIIKNKYL